MSHRIKQFFTGLALGALSWSLPKKRGTVVFYPIHEKRRFSGNLRYLALYMAEHHPELELVWLTPDENTAKIVREAGLRPHVFRSLPLRILAEAEIVVIDSYVKYLMFGNFNIVQVWHGAGYKKIGASNPSNGRWFKRVMLKLQHRQLRMVVAHSESDALQKRAIFETPFVYVTGAPRNDVFFDKNRSTADAAELSEYKKVILYAPTYRESIGAVAFTDEFWGGFNEMLQRINAIFLIKKHPLDRSFNVPHGFSNVRDVTDSLADVQDCLVCADVLVTDYSSVATDYVLTGRPVVFYVYDATEYQLCSRALFYNVLDILPGPFAHNQRELVEVIKWAVVAGDLSSDIEYRRYACIFNEFFDGNSAGRVSRLVVDFLVAGGSDVI